MSHLTGQTIPAAAPPARIGLAVAHGLRWTVWLAALSLPFSYGVRVLLARLGTVPLAAYGLLIVYINFTAAFLFLGGNAVAIRFLPALVPGKRRDFLNSYAVVVVVAWLPWLAAGAWHPSWMTWLFGPVGGPLFIRVMLALAPVPIAFSLCLAALKGVLEIAASQWLYRAVTAGAFLGYFLLWLGARTLLVRYAPWCIWGWYFFLAAVVAIVAWRRLRPFCPRPQRFGWYLPPGFAAYTINLQAASALGFFATQLDVLFVLHRGGVSQLGAYVALISLAGVGIAGLKLLLDGMMTGLTNAAAAAPANGEPTGGQVWHAYIRLLLPLILGFGALLSLAAHPLLAIYGPPYLYLAPALRWLAPGAALYAVNCVLGSALAALGYPQDEIKAKLIRVLAYALAFWPLWSAWGMVGAALSWTVAEAPYQVANLWFLRRRAPFPLQLRRLYVVFLSGLILSTALGFALATASSALALLAWILLLIGYFALAGYRVPELRAQIRLLLPGALRQEWI